MDQDEYKSRLADMLTRPSFLGHEDREAIERIRTRLRTSPSTELLPSEFPVILGAYEKFLLATAPTIVSGGAPGLGRRSSKWYQPDDSDDGGPTRS